MSLRTVERVTVTRIVNVEGQGVAPDPVREVTYWYQDDGTLIQRNDPYTRPDFVGLVDSPGFSMPSTAGSRAVY